MTDATPIDISPRRGRLWPMALLVLLAFLIGIATAAYLSRHMPWFERLAATREAAKRQAAMAPPADYVPPDGESATAPRVDPAVLQTREETLAAQLAALEARTTAISVDAAAAGTQAARAEAVLTVAAARRAVDRGQSLGFLEGQVRARFGVAQPRAVAVLIQGARAPVTLEDLRQGLDSIGADLTTGASDGWGASLGRELSSLIVLRRAGTPSPLPADRLARARRLVDAGQVAAAKAEVALLPGADDAANWQAAANRYVLVRRALDLLDHSALTAQAPEPAVAPPPA